MKLTQSLIVAAATLNLAVGAPIKKSQSRAVLAQEATKRAIANNPYMTRSADAKADAKTFPGSVTPVKLRSLINLLKRNNVGDNVEKRYEYWPTPETRAAERPAEKRYEYKDTPWASAEELVKP
jgi:hypothetical protein